MEGVVSPEDPDLSVRIGRLVLKNPVMLASGTSGFGEEYADFFDLARIGAIITKGISLRPVAGNPPPRIFETEGGMINSIGLQNPGFHAFVKNKLPYLRKIDTHFVVNFFGKDEKEYAELGRRFEEIPGIPGLEMNISCPNIKRGGMAFGSDPKVAYRLTRAVRRSTRLPLIVKLTPNVTDIGLIAKSAEEGGADAVSLINTVRAMAINIRSRKPELGNIMGGLSGPAIKPIAVRMVWETYQKVKIPIIGIGGIVRAEDAVEFMLAGASAVQIGTASLVNPNTGVEVIHGIRRYLLQNRIQSAQKMTGLSQVG